MSKESVRSFFVRVEREEELSEKFNHLLERYDDELRSQIVELARAYGFEFSEEDIRKVEDELLQTIVKQDELPETLLDAVTGGAQGNKRVKNKLGKEPPSSIRT